MLLLQRQKEREKDKDGPFYRFLEDQEAILRKNLSNQQWHTVAPRESIPVKERAPYHLLDVIPEAEKSNKADELVSYAIKCSLVSQKRKRIDDN